MPAVLPGGHPRACPAPALRPLWATACARRTVLGPQSTRYGELGVYFPMKRSLRSRRDACFGYKVQTGQERSEVHSSGPPGSQQPCCVRGFKSPDSGSPPTDPGRPSGPSLFHVALTGAQATWTLGALPHRPSVWAHPAGRPHCSGQSQVREWTAHLCPPASVETKPCPLRTSFPFCTVKPAPGSLAQPTPCRDPGT